MTHSVRKVLRWFGTGLLFFIVALCVAIVAVPPFLDARYYDGPVSGHYDGERFFNPDGEDTAAPPGGGSRAGFFVRYLTGNDDRPEWPEKVTVTSGYPPAEVTLCPKTRAITENWKRCSDTVDPERMFATWIGHATVLVQAGGINILTDPIYADTAGPFGLGPKRVGKPGIAFDNLPKIDLIVVSHNHYDHMDLTTLKRLWDRDRPLIVTSLGNDTLMRKAGIAATAVDWGGRVGVRPGIDVHVTRNHHWGSRWFTDRNRALWASFTVTLPGGNLFFAGDTGFGDGEWPREAAKLGPVRLALIPIGAFRFAPEMMDTGSHIGPQQAVEVFARLGARYAMPIHWGTFRLSYEGYDTPPKLLDRVMLCRGLTDFTAYPMGVPVEVPPVDTPRARLPAYQRPPGCDAKPFAPDLK